MQQPLTKTKIFVFSCGHIYNDLTMAMWLSYFLIYVTRVSGVSNVEAGYLVFISQFVTAVAYLLIGLESDRVNGLFGYSKRKSWHLLGTILVTVSFPPMFLPVVGGSMAAGWSKVIYLTPFVSIFSIGWSSTRISHITLVTELTSNESERVVLNSYRSAMVYGAFIAVYCIMWVLFNDVDNRTWSKADEGRFAIAVFVLLLIGCFFSVLFHVFLVEEKLEKKGKNENEKLEKTISWKDWLKEGQFYAVGLGYMAAGMMMDIFQVYLPLYVTSYLRLLKKYAASGPLILYISGFVTSLVTEKVNSLLRRKPTYLVGTLVTVASLLWMFFLPHTRSLQFFGPTVLFGIGNTVAFITSLSMIADVLGTHTECAAFVYGSFGFTEELVRGFTLLVIQAAQPQCNREAENCGRFFKEVMTYANCFFNVVCLLVLVFLMRFKLGNIKCAS